MSFRVFARRAIAASASVGVGAAAYPLVSAPFPLALSESPASPREKLVVLGSGWGAVALLKNIDPTLYDVSVVSPRNFFLNTPLLPGVTVGTVEARSLIEPVRRLLPGKPGDATFFEAAAIAVDPKARTVKCRDESEITASNPEFTVPYDKLVVAVGAPPNTFGTPGVYENAKFLKEVDDAIDIRRKLADLFETASLPGVPEDEQRRMLSVLVVGGGPTGVEFAAELHDFLREDMPKLYPTLKDKLSITVVQSADHILNTYDERISKYAEEKFARDGIKILTNRRVTNVGRRGCLGDVQENKEGREAPVRRLRVVHRSRYRALDQIDHGDREPAPATGGERRQVPAGEGRGAEGKRLRSGRLRRRQIESRGGRRVVGSRGRAVSTG